MVVYFGAFFEHQFVLVHSFLGFLQSNVLSLPARLQAMLLVTHHYLGARHLS
jgi:hypothetical protein